MWIVFNEKVTLFKDKVIEVAKNKGIELYACGVDRHITFNTERRKEIKEEGWL